MCACLFSPDPAGMQIPPIRDWVSSITWRQANPTSKLQERDRWVELWWNNTPIHRTCLLRRDRSVSTPRTGVRLSLQTLSGSPLASQCALMSCLPLLPVLMYSSADGPTIASSTSANHPIATTPLVPHPTVAHQPPQISHELFEERNTSELREAVTGLLRSGLLTQEILDAFFELLGANPRDWDPLLDRIRGSPNFRQLTAIPLVRSLNNVLENARAVLRRLPERDLMYRLIASEFNTRFSMTHRSTSAASADRAETAPRKQQFAQQWSQMVLSSCSTDPERERSTAVLGSGEDKSLEQKRMADAAVQLLKVWRELIAMTTAAEALALPITADTEVERRRRVERGVVEQLSSKMAALEVNAVYRAGQRAAERDVVMQDEEEEMKGGERKGKNDEEEEEDKC